MKIAGTMYNDCINGPGWRVTVFCSGCDILCEGCQNKHWQNFNFGEPLTRDYMNKIFEELNDDKYTCRMINLFDFYTYFEVKRKIYLKIFVRIRIC